MPRSGIAFCSRAESGPGNYLESERLHFAEEARRRIVMAKFTDSMALDKDQGADTPNRSVLFDCQKPIGVALVGRCHCPRAN
jgi:hypothetical protein